MSGLLDHLKTMQATGVQTVPDALIGCWRRNWIRFGDAGAAEDCATEDRATEDRATEDTATEDRVDVIWLQTASGMGDVRIDPTRPDRSRQPIHRAESPSSMRRPGRT